MDHDKVMPSKAGECGTTQSSSGKAKTLICHREGQRRQDGEGALLSPPGISWELCPLALSLNKSLHLLSPHPKKKKKQDGEQQAGASA